MDQRLITRRQVLIGAGALGALSPLLGPAAAQAASSVGLLRWDLVNVNTKFGIVLAGGTDVGKDSASGDTISLTGSGQANPNGGKAAGGGTFVHHFAEEDEDLSGVYFVTGFGSFQNLHGSLVPTGLIDGIGEITATTGGILTVSVHLVSNLGTTANGVLGIHCNLPGSMPTTEEGITLTVLSFNFAQNGGATLFHVLA